MMIRSCEDYQRLIKDQLAGELEPASEQRLTQHLAECSQCAQEAELLQGVWNQLEAYEEEPVPSHFFVYETERMSLRELLGRLSFPWKVAMGTASAGLVLVAALALSSAELRIESDTVVLSFGAGVRETGGVEAMKAELADQLKTASQEDRAEWIDALRNEFDSLLDQSEQRQQQLVKTALDELESRYSRSSRIRDSELQARFDASLKTFGSAMFTRHDRDMGDVRQQLNRFANYNRHQANQTGAIMATLVEMADTRNN